MARDVACRSLCKVSRIRRDHRGQAAVRRAGARAPHDRSGARNPFGRVWPMMSGERPAPRREAGSAARPSDGRSSEACNRNARRALCDWNSFAISTTSLFEVSSPSDSRPASRRLTSPALLKSSEAINSRNPARAKLRRRPASALDARTITRTVHSLSKRPLRERVVKLQIRIGGHYRPQILNRKRRDSLPVELREATEVLH